MLNSKSLIELVGYSLCILGTITTAHALLDRLFRYPLFSAFITTAPTIMKSIVPSEPFYLWLESRTTNRSIYEMWDIFLIFFFLLTAVFSLMFGCWIFLILKLFSVFNFSTTGIIYWFIFNFLFFLWTAVQQTATTFQIKDRRIKRKDTIISRMQESPHTTFKLIFKYFASNWILAPYNTLKILLIIILALVLFWPAWLIQAFHMHSKIDLNNDTTRTTYFIVYALISFLLGTSLIFFFG